MRSRSRAATTVAAVAAFALAATGPGGCATGPSPETPIVEAFHPDGSGGPDVATDLRIQNARDLVLELSPGDVIEVEFMIDGDLAGGRATLPVVLRRPLLIHASPAGLRGSIDGGEHWAPLPDLVTGSLDVGLAISRELTANTVTVRLQARVD